MSGQPNDHAGAIPGPGFSRELVILDGEFSIHRWSAATAPPLMDGGGELYSLVKERHATTLVCSTDTPVESRVVSKGWRALRLVGPLALDLTGVLGVIAQVLAEAEICIFVISSYDTDTVLVRDRDLACAKERLVSRGYRFVAQN